MLLVSILHFIADDQDPWRIVAALRDQFYGEPDDLEAMRPGPFDPGDINEALAGPRLRAYLGRRPG